MNEDGASQLSSRVCFHVTGRRLRVAIATPTIEPKDVTDLPPRDCRSEYAPKTRKRSFALRIASTETVKVRKTQFKRTVAREVLLSISREIETVKSFRNKLAMVGSVVGSFLGVANAAPIIVFEAPLDNWHQEVSADFSVNRELGRAWVDVKVTTESLSEAPPTEVVIMKMVEGLYYDSAHKQVLYRTASELIVCAEDATFLWKTYLKSTGQCLLNPRTEQRKVDDGFSTVEKTVAQVVFDAQTPHRWSARPGFQGEDR
jgi:hypothetical protein